MNKISEIITLILSIAVLTLLINKATDTAKLFDAGGGALNKILRTITLQ